MIKMTDTAYVTYLANVVLIANSDVVLTPQELAAIEEIRKNIGAKKKSLTSARKAVESGSYTLAKCGDFAVQVCNLADMIYTCFVDGEVSKMESTVALEFAKSIGVTQAQLKVMIKEATERANQLTSKVDCPECCIEINANSKFCPNCGAECITSKDKSIKTKMDIPSTGHSIEFAESTAAGYHLVLRYAKLAPKLETCIRARKTWHIATWPENKFLDVISLAEALSGLRNRKYYHNGSEEPWDKVFAFLWCYKMRESAYRPVEYCFGKDENRINLWGCKQVGLDWTEWARWFSYGQFKKSGLFKKSCSWIFDKERIRHEIMSNVHQYIRCPHHRAKLLKAAINALPDEVEISPKSGWVYNKIHEEVPGCIEVVEIEKSDGYEYKQEYYSDGVRPRGLVVLKQVLTQAFYEAKVKDVSVKELVK